MFLGRRFFIIFFIDHCSCPVVQNNARDYTFGSLFGSTWVTFWHHLGDFGRHFGTSWAPRGSQNQAFGHQVAPKSQSKKLSRKGELRRPSFLTILAPFGQFWGPFGRFRAPCGSQLGAKGLPKSIFLAPSRTKNSKNESQNEASKNV